MDDPSELDDHEYAEPEFADPYHLINVQLSYGQRINVVLEVEGAYVTSFKVSGSDPLSNHLNALIGYPEPAADMGRVRSTNETWRPQR